MSYLVQRHCKFVADGLMQGKLFEINGYHSAIVSDNSSDKVQRELYYISNPSLLAKSIRTIHC